MNPSERGEELKAFREAIREQIELEQDPVEREEVLKAFREAIREEMKLGQDPVERQEELEAFREAIREHMKLEEEAAKRRSRAEFLRQLALEPGYSYTTDWVSGVAENWQSLREKYRDRPGVRMLEIGSFEGRSAVWFLENVLTHPSAELVCIDPFLFDPFAEARFDHNILLSGWAEKVEKLKGASEEFLLAMPLESFDVIYVDGDHHAANVLLDGVLSWYRLKPGGAMIFDDDWVDRLPDSRPRMAIDLFLQLFQGQMDLALRARGQVLLWKHESGLPSAEVQ